eukprot:4915334-Pyramimonas_sp.AAC.1
MLAEIAHCRRLVRNVAQVSRLTPERTLRWRCRPVDLRGTSQSALVELGGSSQESQACGVRPS